MINMYEVSETNKMIESENLDVRTITLGISLLDCVDSDLDELNRKIYEKITTVAKDLVSTGKDIEKEFGIPIVNKRISITPVSLVGAAACKTPEDYVTIARTLDRAAEKVGVNFIGGYSALVSKGMTPSEENLIRSIPQALAETERICSSVNVGSTKTGINMDAVRLCGQIVKEAAEATKDRDSLGCAKLVILCNAPDDNPFMAGAFLGVTEADTIINVGVSGPGVVKKAIEKARGKGFEELCETIKKTAFKITRVGQLVAGEASARLGIPFGIIDLSLAPTPAVGDSIAEILEEIGLERVGAPGTTAALAMLNDQVKKGGVMASSYVGGLSGAFIPVSEDQGMIDAVNAGSLTIEKLEAMTCVCSVGLDMIAIPGKTSAATISGIIADEMAIGMVNQKTTAVRLIPVIGKDVGDVAEFGGQIYVGKNALLILDRIEVTTGVEVEDNYTSCIYLEEGTVKRALTVSNLTNIHRNDTFVYLSQGSIVYVADRESSNYQIKLYIAETENTPLTEGNQIKVAEFDRITYASAGRFYAPLIAFTQIDKSIYAVEATVIAIQDEYNPEEQNYATLKEAVELSNNNSTLKLIKNQEIIY